MEIEVIINKKRSTPGAQSSHDVWGPGRGCATLDLLNAAVLALLQEAVFTTRTHDFQVTWQQPYRC